jgi:hypothetical protein
MPVLDAYPLSGVFEGHYRASFPEGERTYPSASAIRLAAARIGAAVRIHDRASGPAADTSGGHWGPASGEARLSPRTPVKAPAAVSESPKTTRR